MSGLVLEPIVAAYGAAALLPLAVIEGPVVSVAAGLLSAHGLLSWPLALSLLIAGDLVGDSVLYWIGRSGGARFGLLGRWIGHRLGADRGLAPDLQRRFARQGTRLLLIGKWTHAIGAAVLVGAGMVRMPFWRFALVNLLATIPKSTLLFALGYFAWRELPALRADWAEASLALLALGAAAAAWAICRSQDAPVDGTPR
ncbi:MAG: VTT domain-containing protein [Proteobacteria bacterium]|nr:VTT domain-containing protein [Pseudomonadota bacterium]